MSHAALRLVGITKLYRSNTVLGPIDLSLEEGRIYGLIGENGAGKSTLIRIVMGLSKPTSGTVELIGQRGSAGLRNARSNIGYVPDSSASYPLLSAADNLKARCLEWGLDQRQIPRILDMIGLADAGNKRARSFSLGMRKRLDLGIALLGQPRMLVLDEPTNGLDPLGTIEIRELIKRLNRERGTTVLISSHNLAELHQTATDYVILSGGKLMAELTAGDVERLSGGNLEKLYARIMMGHHNKPCRGEAAPQHLRRPSKPISTSGDDRDVRRRPMHASRKRHLGCSTKKRSGTPSAVKRSLTGGFFLACRIERLIPLTALALIACIATILNPDNGPLFMVAGDPNAAVGTTIGFVGDVIVPGHVAESVLRASLVYTIAWIPAAAIMGITVVGVGAAEPTAQLSQAKGIPGGATVLGQAVP